MFFDSPIFVLMVPLFSSFLLKHLTEHNDEVFFLLFTLSAKQDLGQNFVLACSFFLLLLSLFLLSFGVGIKMTFYFWFFSLSIHFEDREG